MNAPQARQPRKTKTALKASAAAAPEPVVHPIVLRTATPRDASALYDVLIRYFEELKLFYPPPVEGPTMAWGLSIILKGGVIVAEQNGEILGSIGLEIGNFPWAPSVSYLNGVWFYVAPERRKGLVAERLMRSAKDTGIKMGLAVRLDNVFGIEPELQDKYRQRHGFAYVGGNHVWFPPAPVQEG